MYDNQFQGAALAEVEASDSEAKRFDDNVERGALGAMPAEEEVPGASGRTAKEYEGETMKMQND